jgi:hypothetical protein
MARTKSSRRPKQSRNNKSSDETKIISGQADEINDDTLATYQSIANQKLYDFISSVYSELKDEVEATQAVGVIVSAVSTNLGMILAQIPESARSSYMNVASNIVQQSLVNTLEVLAEQSHGQIGHA